MPRNFSWHFFFLSFARLCECHESEFAGVFLDDSIIQLMALFDIVLMKIEVLKFDAIEMAAGMNILSSATIQMNIEWYFWF